MSGAMLAFILTYIALYGISASNPDADEGTAAHIFQLWVVIEALAVAFFAIKWLPQSHRQALMVLALQVAAALLPISIVYVLAL